MSETTIFPAGGCVPAIDLPGDASLATPPVPAHKMALLSQILRGIGGLIILAAAAVFMLQHWHAGNDLHRYGMLLCFSVLLSAAGIFCGLRLKESKGARTLLGLTLAVTPVHFAVLGGLLYSRFALDSAWTVLPGYATWVAPGAAAALLVAGGALALLLPLGHFSFLTLGRSCARWLTATFFTANLALLLPVRSPDPIGLLVAAIGLCLVTAEIRIFSRQASLKTREGHALRLLMAAPAVLLVVRTVGFYAVSHCFLAGVLASLALALFLLGPRVAAQAKTQRALQTASTLPAAAAWILIADPILHASRLGPGWAIPLIVLPLAGTLMAMSCTCQGAGTGYRRGAAIVALAGVSANLLVSPGVAASALCLVTGIGSFAYGYYVEQKLILCTGLVAALLGLGTQLSQAIHLYSLFNWGSLALIGVGVILAASFLERNHAQLLQKAAEIRRRLRGWDY